MSHHALDWDYTRLAPSYSYRPRYAPRTVDRIVAACGKERPLAADIGAGTGHLTLDLLERHCVVDAVEPNEAMRAIGVERTAGRGEVRWSVGVGEDTGLPGDRYDLVAYGSAFSTTDQPRALVEAARMLHDRGWFACVWNHRRLDDPLQAEIEELIRAHVPGYSYGRRREDHGPLIERSGLFTLVTRVEDLAVHRLPVDDWLTAWRSHATLQRQAGPAFEDVLRRIDELVRSRAGDEVEVPYRTVGWLAARVRR
ncbi:class I SAM-dependent methyltransferase [Saccharothrix syringae]|uniref:Class I SAM-dependent methyltransferase n=1 Tax=Saccharothrix syringae TaxID=103733 RepID=A0A5Q0GZY1_SACSY|nr:class I SAM-dependent methyltransferase [Saccharothrix syringae]QFZ19551.1 class I SAM-dependent methyltransferase [Saccharothrix syringae]